MKTITLNNKNRESINGCIIGMIGHLDGETHIQGNKCWGITIKAVWNEDCTEVKVSNKVVEALAKTREFKPFMKYVNVKKI